MSYFPTTRRVTTDGAHMMAERRALESARLLLGGLTDPHATPDVPEQVREMARRILIDYPISGRLDWLYLLDVISPS